MNDQIPQQIKDFASSPEISDSAEKVGQKFGLHIDQIGELDAEIRDVLRGFSKSTDFTEHLTERLEIERGLALQITTEVNKEIFEVLRKKLTISPSTSEDLSGIEKAGNFSVEPSLASPAADGHEPQNSLHEEVNDTDRADILSSIENPGPTAPTITDKRAEPLVDHLLTTPTVQTEQQITPESEPVPPPMPIIKPKTPPKPASTPTPRPVSPPRTGSDPYRESVE